MTVFLSAVTLIPVQDMPRARAFYEDMLGLTPLQQVNDRVLYAAGAAHVLLYPSQFAGEAGHTLVRLLAADARAAVRELRERGLLFEDIDFPEQAGVAGELIARFKDSEGNLIGIGEAG